MRILYIYAFLAFGKRLISCSMERKTERQTRIICIRINLHIYTYTLIFLHIHTYTYIDIYIQYTYIYIPLSKNIFMNDIYIIIMSLHSIVSFNNSFNYVFYFVLKIILVKTCIRYTYYFLKSHISSIKLKMKIFWDLYLFYNDELNTMYYMNLYSNS